MKEIVKRKTKGVALLDTTQIVHCIKIEEIQMETVATPLVFQTDKVYTDTFKTVLNTEYVQDYGRTAYLPITNQILQFWEIKNN